MRAVLQGFGRLQISQRVALSSRWPCGHAISTAGATLVYLALFVGWSYLGQTAAEAASATAAPSSEMDSLLSKPPMSPPAAAPAQRRKSPKRHQERD